MLTDRDLGYRDILRRLAGLHDPATLVGVQAEDGASTAPGDSSNLATIAAANEFGTQHIPERSFLRATVDANAASYGQDLDAAVQAHIDGETPLPVGLARLGARVEGDVKQYMTDLQDPPNAPATIERKGSSNPLIDTGRLRASIRHREEGANLTLETTLVRPGGAS